MLASEVPVSSARAVIVVVRNLFGVTYNVLADRVLAHSEIGLHGDDFRNNGRYHKILLFRYYSIPYLQNIWQIMISNENINQIY